MEHYADEDADFAFNAWAEVDKRPARIKEKIIIMQVRGIDNIPPKVVQLLKLVEEKYRYTLKFSTRLVLTHGSRGNHRQ